MMPHHTSHTELSCAKTFSALPGAYCLYKRLPLACSFCTARVWILAVSVPDSISVLHVSHLQDYFELGVILLRKKLFTQATKNLEKAKKTWDGEPDELAQVWLICTIPFAFLPRFSWSDACLVAM